MCCVDVELVYVACFVNGECAVRSSRVMYVLNRVLLYVFGQLVPFCGLVSNSLAFSGQLSFKLMMCLFMVFQQADCL